MDYAFALLILLKYTINISISRLCICSASSIEVLSWLSIILKKHKTTDIFNIYDICFYEFYSGFITLTPEPYGITIIIDVYFFNVIVLYTLRLH